MYSVNIILILLFTFTFHHYYLSMQAVTNKRIIDIDQRSLFSREVNEMSIDKIQDVSHRQPNFVSVLFGFGDVIIQTAGGDSGNSEQNDNVEKPGDFKFENVPSPSQIATTISTLYHKNKEDEMRQAADLNAQAIFRTRQQAIAAREQQANNIYGR